MDVGSCTALCFAMFASWLFFDVVCDPIELVVPFGLFAMIVACRAVAVIRTASRDSHCGHIVLKWPCPALSRHFQFLDSFRFTRLDCANAASIAIAQRSLLARQ